MRIKKIMQVVFKINRNFSLVAGLVFALNINAFGQSDNISDIIPPSPNVAGLMKFGDVPVSLYAGIPDITIPIYNIESKYLSLPISVRYHAGGLRVGEFASSVGLGWSLDYGGAISRTQMGLKDEKPIVGFMNAGEIPNLSPSTLSLYEDYAKGEIDSEADQFSFSVPGSGSGKFVIAKDDPLDPKSISDRVVMRPRSRDLFNFNIFSENYTDNYGSSSLTHIEKWDVINDAGQKYLFEDREYSNLIFKNNLMGSNPPLNESPKPVVTAWQISSITAANDLESIQFEYEAYQTTYYGNIAETGYYIWGGKTDSRYQSSFRSDSKRIKKITFPDGFVDFEYMTDERCDLLNDFPLARIVVTKNAVVKEFVFNYAYATFSGLIPYSSCAGAYNNDPLLRLVLTSVDEIVQMELHEPAKTLSYTFEYQDEFLPSRFSMAQDYWGFYNGEDQNTSLIPKQLIEDPLYGGSATTIGTANRLPNPQKALAGMIKSITYPTGGQTQFDFEINRTNNVQVPHQLDDITEYLSGASSSISKVLPLVRVLNPFISVSMTPDILPPSFVDPLCEGHFRIREVSNNKILLNVDFDATDLGQEFNFDLELPSKDYIFAIEIDDALCPVDEMTNYSLSWSNEIPSTTKPSGGVRVKAIHNIDDGPTSSQYFTYTNEDGSSTGDVVVVPEYGYEYSETDQGGTFYWWVCTAFTNSPLTYTQGSPTGYSRVLQHNSPVFENGFTDNYFTSPTNHPDQFQGAWRFPFAPLESMEWRRGKLMDQYNWKKNLVGYDTVSAISNKYNFEDVPIEGLVSMVPSVKSVKAGITGQDLVTGAVSSFASSEYYFNTSKTTLSSTTSRTHNPNDDSQFIESKTKYWYDHNNYLVKKEKAVGADNLVTEYHYPEEYDSFVDGGNYTSMVALNMLNVKVATEQTKEQDGLSFVLGSTYSTFEDVGGAIFPANQYIHEFSGTQISSVFDPSTANQYSGNERLVSTAVLRDNMGNILEHKDKNGQSSSIIWDFEKRYPLAVINNAENNMANVEVFYQSYDDKAGFTLDASAVGGYCSLVLSAAYDMATSVTLKTGENYILSYWWKQNTGDTWEYKEDLFNNYSGEPLLTSITSGYIDEIKFRPADAQIQTFHYDLRFGKPTIVTDANEFSVFYEYDNLGRLKHVKDMDGNIISLNEYHYQENE